MRLKHFLITLLAAIALPYTCSPVYRFPDPLPFAGAGWHNPYRELTGAWQRANLHAHGVAWWGLTNGRQPSEEIVRHYRARGYTVAGVSNYQQIAAHRGIETLPLYEHGYNLGKHHQLAVGARQVVWFDFPLWQTTSQKQFVIDRVARHSELVALVHPLTRGGYSARDLSRLTGYHLLEVVNGPYPALHPWDVALSSGRVVWAIANDDTHDLTDADRDATAWTMIDAPSASTAEIVAALEAGRGYAVWKHGPATGAPQTVLSSVAVANGRLRISVAGAKSTFTFVGQDGVVRKTVADALSAEYTIGKHDTYIRTAIQAPGTTLFLNPVFRHDGGDAPPPAAAFDTVGTWLLRFGILLALLFLATAVRFIRGASRQPRTQPVAPVAGGELA